MKNREEIANKIQSMSTDDLVDLYIKSTENAEELNWLKEQLAMLNKVRYSSKSEKAVVGQLNLFNEVEEISDTPVLEEPVKKVKNKKKREANFSKLPTNVIHHELTTTHCEICGCGVKQLAPQTIDVLKYQPARYYIERHLVHQGICPTCTDEHLEAEITIAKGAPKRLIKGSVVSSSVVAGIVFNKFVSGTPLYRQEQELKRKKIEISRASMSNWLMNCAKQVEPVYKHMQEDIKKASHIHMDETPVTVLEDKQEEGREKSYMWMAATGKHEKQQMVVYRYNKSREHAFAKEIIGEGYTGSIHCDGYEAYHKLEHATILGCMAHCRRKFIEAMEVSPLHRKAKTMKKEALEELCEENPSYGNIVRIVGIIKYLFQQEKSYIESQLKPNEIRKKRQEQQTPKLDELFQCLEQYEQEYTRKSKMGEAIVYALNQKKYLITYVKDGRAELTNNRAERLIKPFVMGRKAWLFCNTKSGATMSSIYYSLIESAKMNNLDIHNYIEYILTQLADCEETKDYEKLLPYASDLPQELRIK